MMGTDYGWPFRDTEPTPLNLHFGQVVRENRPHAAAALCLYETNSLRRGSLSLIPCRRGCCRFANNQ
jgi:hypothetical protein